VSLDDLRDAQLFAGLSDAQLGHLEAISHTLQLSDGELLFRQGQPGAAFYLLADGTIKVFKRLRDGRTATIRHVHAGDTFAESALFTPTYPANTEAMEDSRLLRFPTEAFRALILDEPDIGLRLLSNMAHLLVVLSNRVEELLLPVPARLARYLLDLCGEEDAATGRGSLACVLPISKRELAARLGTVPETLSRTFNQLVRAKTIAVDGDRFEVLDLAALERVAQN
jgi:CRP/FNR family transcriptional regulator, dissimilatory nitrate respiration regulator